MINYVRHNEIDLVKWDGCIDRSLNGNFSAYSWYLNCVCPGWDALVEGDYETIMPLPNKSKFGIRYIFPPFFVNQLGVFSGIPLTSEKTDLFLKNIPSEFKFVQAGLNSDCVPSSGNFHPEKKECQFISLKKSFDEIEKTFSENLKRNLKKAGKNGMLLSSDVSAGELTEQFRRGRGEALGHFTGSEYIMLQSLLESIIKNGKGWIAGCRSSDGELLCSAFFCQSHNRITYLKGGASDRGKETGAMHFLFSDVLQKHSGSGMIFDFGGSSVPSVARFNNSFGAGDYFYYELKRNTLPFFLRWMKK